MIKLHQNIRQHLLGELIFNSKAQIIYEIVVLATGFGEFEFSRTFWRMWNFFDICVLSIWFSRIFLTFLEYQFEFYRTFWHRYVGFNLKFSAFSLRKFEFSRPFDHKIKLIFHKCQNNAGKFKLKFHIRQKVRENSNSPNPVASTCRFYFGQIWSSSRDFRSENGWNKASNKGVKFACLWPLE